MQLQAVWSYPNHIRAGAGRLQELPACCTDLGIKAPLLLTDPGLAVLPMVMEAVQLCRQAGLRCELFSDIQSNPNGDNVMAGVMAYKAGQHDGVIAFGGGSALDCGKAVAMMVGQDGSLWDYEDVDDNSDKINAAAIAPIIAVPTTAGTGSEVGRAAVITDAEQQRKKIIYHPKMLPAIVLLDPLLSVGLPANLTAATGMDALSHNLEALCSPGFHPMAAGIAVEGIRLVKEFLPTAVADGQDLEARMQMLVASSMGATAFQKGLGAMHALAHPLGAIYNSHHGLLNAILMPYVLMANRSVIDAKISRLAAYLGLADASFEGFLHWLLALRQQLAIPHCLAEIGIDQEQAERIGQMALVDPCAAGNPITFTAEQYRQLFSDAVLGRL